MTTLALWLIEPGTASAGITQQNIQPPRFPTAIEADWLWSFLHREKDKKPLLDRANMIADMPVNGKNALKDWIETVSQLAIQFQPLPPIAWPMARPHIDPAEWTAFKILMEAFYEKGLRSESGLPYRADGTPVALQVG